jgi:hypothetical protein
MCIYWSACLRLQIFTNKHRYISSNPNNISRYFPLIGDEIVDGEGLSWSVDTRTVRCIADKRKSNRRWQLELPEIFAVCGLLMTSLVLSCGVLNRILTPIFVSPCVPHLTVYIYATVSWTCLFWKKILFHTLSLPREDIIFWFVKRFHD